MWSTVVTINDKQILPDHQAIGRWPSDRSAHSVNKEVAIKICISLRQYEENFMGDWGCQGYVIWPSPCTWVLMVLGRQVLKVMLRSCSRAALGSADERMYTQQLRACWNCRVSDAAADQGIGNYLHINIWEAMACRALLLNWHPPQTLNSWLAFWCHRSMMRFPPKKSSSQEQWSQPYVPRMPCYVDSTFTTLTAEQTPSEP